LAQLGSGACFGEGALLDNTPRAATATALTDSRLFALTRDAFTSILDRYPAVKSNLVSLHSSRSRAPMGDGSAAPVA
jgi:CRP/FNR family transcriptional regulator